MTIPYALVNDQGIEAIVDKIGLAQHPLPTARVFRLYGIPGSGKTPLLKRLAVFFHPPARPVLSILISCDQIAHVHNWESDLAHGACEQISTQLSLQVSLLHDWTSLVEFLNEHREFVSVFLFDAAECLADDVFSQLELKIAEIVQNGLAVVIVAGYRERPQWRYLPIPVRASMLKEIDVTKLILADPEASNPAMIYQLVHARLLDTLDHELVQAEAILLSKCATETQTAIRHLSIFRKFNRRTMDYLAQSQLLGPTHHLTEGNRQAYIQQMQQFDLVIDWTESGSSSGTQKTRRRITHWVVDPTARAVLGLTMKKSNPEHFALLHKVALDYQDAEIDLYPDRSDKTIPEALYHQVQTGFFTLDLALGSLDKWLAQLPSTDAANALYQTLDSDTELGNLYGAQYETILQKVRDFRDRFAAKGM